jgi:hypothetical protein
MVSKGAAIRLILSAGVTVSTIASAFAQTRVLTEPHKLQDPRTAMIDVLPARRPHPSLGDEASVFDRFVGTWDCDYMFYLDDGSTSQAKGELEFGWVLDGRAMQDIWISYPKEAGKERGIGTTVRFYDPKTKTWRIIFVGPASGDLVEMKGGLEGDRIVLRGIDDDKAILRWSFNDLTANAFVWRGEKSRDGGKTWKLEEEHHMTRRTGLGASPSSSAHINDPRLDMIRVLRSSGPNSTLGTEAQIFDRFIGTWEMDCTFYDANGKTSRLLGEWRFGWALDGRIEQDVIVEHQRRELIARGTTLRFYDTKLGKWRIVWIAPPTGNVAMLTGGAVGDRIVLEGVDVDGSPFRWSFNNIRPDSFVWRGEISADGGKTWRLEQEMRLKRRNPRA